MRPGRVTLPRLRVNPHFAAAIRASRLPYEPLALAVGCRAAHFSYLINSVGIPSTPKNIEAMLRAADAIKFPRDQVFLDNVPVAEPNEAVR